MSNNSVNLLDRVNNGTLQKSATGQQSQSKDCFTICLNPFVEAPLAMRLVTLLTDFLFVASAYLSTSNQKQISDRFMVYTQPPGVFFSIWGFIFVTTGIVNLMNVLVRDKLCTVAFCLLINCAHFSGILWICIFSLGTKNAVIASCFALISFVVSLFLAWIQLGRYAKTARQSSRKNIMLKFYLFRNIIAFWLGWTIAAANLGIGIVLVYWFQFQNITQVVFFWILAPLCAIGATIFSYLTQGKTGLLSCLCLWISVIWAFIGAAISTINHLNE